MNITPAMTCTVLALNANSTIGYIALALSLIAAVSFAGFVYYMEKKF